MDKYKFMKKYGIPKGRIDFKGMSENRQLYEGEIFNRKIGGEAFSAEKQHEIAQRYAKHWKGIAGDNEDFRIADIGCGLGYHVRAVNEMGLKASGLNLSFIEAELASRGEIDPDTKEMKWQEEKKADVVVGDSLNIPYKTGSLDGVSCYGVLMMLPHTERIYGRDTNPIDVCTTALEEMHRVLKPGGHLNLVTFSKNASPDGKRTEDYIFFGENDYIVYDKDGGIVNKGGIGIRDILERVGFRSVELEEKYNSMWRCTAYK